MLASGQTCWQTCLEGCTHSVCMFSEKTWLLRGNASQNVGRRFWKGCTHSVCRFSESLWLLRANASQNVGRCFLEGCTHSVCSFSENLWLLRGNAGQNVGRRFWKGCAHSVCRFSANMWLLRGIVGQHAGKHYWGGGAHAQSVASPGWALFFCLPPSGPPLPGIRGAPVTGVRCVMSQHHPRSQIKHSQKSNQAPPEMEPSMLEVILCMFLVAGVWIPKPQNHSMQIPLGGIWCTKPLDIDPSPLYRSLWKGFGVPNPSI